MRCVNRFRSVLAPATSFALFFGFAPGLLANSGDEGSASAAQADKQHLAEAYGKLPLSFEANTGQTSSEVKFLSRGQAYALFLTRTGEAVLVLQGASGKEKSEQSFAEAEPPAVLRMKPVGVTVSPQAAGLDQLPGHVNYFLGNDPKKWRTNVPTYARVNFREVYPGVDLAYYGNQQQLEYDFIVGPHADPNAISMKLEGPERASLDANGDLVLTINKKDVRFRKPVVYQEFAGHRREIAGSYILKSHRQVGFQIAAYDPSQPLTIDPVLAYSTYLGGSVSSAALSVTVDRGGNAFVTGSAIGTDFPTTPGAFQATGTTPCSGFSCRPSQTQEAFVAEINPKGSALVFSTYLGGTNFNVGTGIAQDDGGNTYVTGYTDSSDFPTTPGTWQPVFHGSRSGGCLSCETVNSFVTKLNPSGNALVYSTFLGGFADTLAHGMGVDSDGNAYVAGFAGAGFPTTPGAFQPDFKGRCCEDRGPYDAFVAKVNPSGSGPVYATYVGGSNGNQAYGMALDRAGDVYIGGLTGSSDFPTTPGAFQATAPQSSISGFVTKLNSDGSALVYSTYLGGTNLNGASDTVQAIAVDSGGNAYVTGFANSLDFPTTPGAFQPVAPSKRFAFSSSAFVTKLNPAGSGLAYSTYLGGSKSDDGVSIAVDSSGDAFVTGSTDSDDFPATANALQPMPPDNFTCCHTFVTALNRAGSALLYSSYLGGSTPSTQSLAITLDSSANAYIVGDTSSTNFPTTPGAFQRANPAAQNFDNAAFITKITGITSSTPAATAAPSAAPAASQP